MYTSHRVLWIVLCSLVGFTFISAQNQTLKHWFDSPIDGQVNSIVVAGNTAYLGGSFTQCGFSTGYGVAVDTGTADADHYFPKFFNTPGGQIYCAIPDSQGGWYIGGSFTTVNGQPHKYLAHVRSDKSVDSWDPSPNHTVSTIYYSGNKIYVGGGFDSIGNVPRGHGAAFDTSGNLLSWNPQANNDITAIQPVGGKVFVGGSFQVLGGQPYYWYLGSVDSSTGALTGWNPSNGGPSGSSGIYKFIYANHQIYICGAFTQLNSVSRICLAKMDENGNINAVWNPCSSIVGNFVSSISLSNGKIYACGDFTSIGGQTRKNIAEIDTATGLATSWNPASTNGAVRALVVNGSKMFIGGSFTSIGAKSISYLGALDVATGAANNWNPKLNNVVFNLASWGSTVYAGGYLTASGLTARNRLAAIDLGTGRLKSWNPNADGTVYALAYAQGKIYAGGGFSYVAGGYYPNLTKLDTLSGAYIFLGIRTAPGGTVLSLRVTGDRLYAAGNYGLVAYNIPTGTKLSFNPTFDFSVVNTLCTSGSLVYAGGGFSVVNGVSHPYVVAFDTTTDLATSWSPSLSSTCYSIAVHGSTVYLGGQFSTVNGSSCPSVAAVDAASGNLVGGFASSFSAIGYKASAVAPSGNQLYVGGQFSPIGSISGTNYLGTLDATTGTVSSWRSGVVATEVTSILLSPQTALIGGSFVTMMNWPQNNFAVLGDDSITNATLPVELTSFTASMNGRNAELKWATATESNNYGFEVEKKKVKTTLESMKWEKIGFIEGKGTSNVSTQYSFLDKNLSAGKHSYRLKQIDRDGKFKYSDEAEVVIVQIPQKFSLSQNYPNPFNPTTVISYQIPMNGHVSLKVYDAIGREVATLVNELEGEGNYSVPFDASNLSSGIYFARLQSGDKVQLKKMLLMK